MYVVSMLFAALIFFAAGLWPIALIFVACAFMVD